MVVKCPQGHRYETDAPGATGRCPQCATQTQTETSVSDDDVLAIIGEPVEPPKPVAQEPVKPPGSGIMRRKKICPECSHEASFSFVYCPRCGAPLKLASVEMRKA
jgi:hypothetical protein